MNERIKKQLEYIKKTGLDFNHEAMTQVHQQIIEFEERTSEARKKSDKDFEENWPKIKQELDALLYNYRIKEKEKRSEESHKEVLKRTKGQRVRRSND